VNNPIGKERLEQIKAEKKKTLTGIISKGEIIDRLSKWF
jgi:hypothetical protein